MSKRMIGREIIPGAIFHMAPDAKPELIDALKELATFVQKMIDGIEPHDCSRFSSVLVCDGETDTLICRICGKQWESPCNFDDDYR